MVNQTSDEGCLSRATIGSEGSLFKSQEGFLSRGASRRPKVPTLSEGTSPNSLLASTAAVSAKRNRLPGETGEKLTSSRMSVC
jgi:hypothetical protein